MTSFVKNAIFLMAVIFFFLLASPLEAQVPSNSIDCTNTSSKEFHSLRPYQKSACEEKVKDTAQFCGNALSVSDSVSSAQLIAPVVASNCKSIGNGKYKCEYSKKDVNRYFNIDVSDIEFPILGNTEDVINSTNQNESLNDAEKMNEYVSWYLNGVNGRAEYRPLSDNDEDIRKLIDFSGPLKKLLPLEIINNAKIEQIEKAGKPDERHDQIVGCYYGVSLPVFNPFTGENIVVGGIPVSCYGDGIADKLKTELRLSDWNNDSRKPPKASDPEFDDLQDYLVAYEEWRGNTCIAPTIPFFGGVKVVICIDNFLKPNYYSKLFQNIPLSSTEDRKGALTIDSKNVTASDPDVKIENVDLIVKRAPLWFSHTEEVVGTSSLLQTTYVPHGQSGEGSATNTVDPPENEGCNLLNVRTNPGEETFPGALEVDITYDIEYSCTFEAYEYGVCNKGVTINLGTATETPQIEEIWERLVGGPASIFKKIFPKIGKGTDFGAILDIPGSSKVTYTGDVNQTSEVYFPHLGGMDEYLLTGIQTLLRPKGYGEQISWGSPDEITSCGTGLKKLSPPGSSTSKASDYFKRYIKPKLTDKLMDIYAQAEKKTGVPCEVLAGVHHMEGSNNLNQSLQNGGALSGSLLQSAIQAGNEIKAKVGGKISNWNQLITALSRYNGGGNRNCGRGLGYTGPCPPPEGIDDPYPTAWLDSRHLEMWLIYCADHTQCTPYPPFERPGALSVAIEVMKSSK